MMSGGPAVHRPRDAAIFVAGMPRSGTSLMRDILGAHPDVAMFPGELPLWREIAAAHRHRDLARPAERERLVRDLLAHPRMAQAGVALDGDAILAALATAPAVTAGTVFAVALREYARQAGKPRWGVKDPRNEFCGDWILAELPAARIVHMVRDPRDVLASQRARWGASAQHAVSTVYDWRRSAALARSRPRESNGWIAVRYEDLVAEPARVVRQVCEALDLPFAPEMLHLGTTRSPEPAAAPALAAAAPLIRPASVGRHARDVPPGDLRYIEWRAGREMAEWGYAARAPRGGRALLLRRAVQEAGWRAALRLGLQPILARALGRLPRDPDEPLGRPADARLGRPARKWF